MRITFIFLLSIVATALAEGFVHQGTRLHISKLNRPQLKTTTSLLVAQALSGGSNVNQAAIGAISKLLSTCGIGVWASKNGLLDQAAMGALSKLVFNLFQPCLLFVNLANTVANLGKSGNSAAIYLLPLAAMFQIFMGYGVGKLVSTLLYGGKDSDEAKQLEVCTSFSNSGALPLVFADSIFQRHSMKSLHPEAISYISLYLLGWSPLFWIIGPAILSDSDPNVNFSDKMKVLTKRVLSPPVLASLAGIAVGFVPFLHKLFLAKDGLLNPVFEAMKTLSAGYLPAVMLVLAGSLAASAATPVAGAVAEGQQKSDSSSGFMMQVFAIYLARFLLMPLTTFGLLKVLGTTFPEFGKLISEDKMLAFVLLLEACMPSAQNTTVILQLQGNKTGAAKLARALMALYVLGIPALSYWLVQILTTTQLAE